jgi:TP901 family phage tail tape measure protein
LSNYVLNWILKLQDGISSPLGAVAANVKKFVSGLGGAGDGVDKFGDRLFKINQAAQAIGGMQSALEGFTSKGSAFEQQVANLDALTDIPKSKIDELAQSAKTLNREFGGGAANNVEAYKNILGRLGPGIADSPEALNSMGRSVLTLAKASGLDAVQSVDALTTSMLQFNDDLSNPQTAAEIMASKMNVLAAAAKVGAAEVPQLTQAINVAGTAAYNSNVSFEETTASIEALAQGGKYGAEAGTALRNVLGKLEEGRFLPKTTKEELMAAGVNINVLSNKSLSLTDRLRELQKIQGDSALVTQMFGTENAAAANVLLRNIDFIDSTKTSITGTSVATEQAAINMDTFNGKMERMAARMENFSISAFNATKEVLPFAHGITQTALNLTQMLPAIEAARTAYTSLSSGSALSSLSKMFSSVTASASTMGASMWAAIAPVAVPVGIVVAAVAALGAGMYYLYNRSESFRTAIDNIVSSASAMLSSVVNFVKPILIDTVNSIIDGFEYMFAFVLAKGTGFLNSPFMKDFVSFWVYAGEGIMNVGRNIGAFLTGVWNFFSQGIPRIVSTVESGMSSVYNSIASWLYRAGTFIWDSFIQPVVGFYVYLWERADAIFGGILSSIMNAFSSAANWIYANFITPVVQVFSVIGKTIDDIFGGIFTAIYSKIAGFFNWVVEKYNSVASYFGLDAKVGDWNKIDIKDMGNNASSAASTSPTAVSAIAAIAAPKTPVATISPMSGGSGKGSASAASAGDGKGTGKTGTVININNPSFAQGATFQNTGMGMKELERLFSEFLISASNSARLSTD